MDNKKVLIIGAGIAGIQAALDLANIGEDVILIEANPSIGGRMAQLDKTFPTNDCSICILAPKMVECARHPNIILYTYAELEEARPVDDFFRVKIRRKQRYVDEKKCTGCGICSENCPIEVPNEFDMNLRMRNAIYIPFPQAVPNVATIDREACIECRTCENTCQARAINLDAPKDGEIREILAHSILIATGFQLFDPSVITQYGYGRFANVLTSLEYERVMCASGPTGGRILRLADGKEPRSIIFIQCVGSRSESYRPYCSRVCCMYATKEAIITKEHNSSIDVTILYNDLRAYGKGFFEYSERARQEYGINYLNAIPQSIEEDPLTKDLHVYFENFDSGILEERTTDLIILCPAIIPNNGTEELAKKLGIGLNSNGFFKTRDEFQEIETEIPGIHIIGACSGPKDIPESVAVASGGAMKAILKRKEKIESKKRPEVPQEEVGIGLAPRVGVFICHCGTNIGGFINVPEIVEHVRMLPNVVFVEDTLYTCSEDSQVIIKDAIKQHDLNRVIVASCTPRTHEPLFRATCSEAGLNQYLFEMANIREQVSWVHMSEPEQATEKAKDLIRMAIQRAVYLEPQDDIRTEVTPAALIVGGGIGGMTAALNIARKGFQVHLVEKEKELGGLVKRLHSLAQDHLLPDELITPLVNQVQDEPKIEIYMGAQIIEMTGSIGNFEITISKEMETRKVNVGVILVSVGAEELKPLELYGYGEYPQVKTLLEYEHLLGNAEIKDGDNIAMILCAGAREQEGVTYCSAVCCLNAINNAILTKKNHPNTEVSIIYRDICVTGENEKHYRIAREMGIQFIKYKRETKPTLESMDDKIKLNVNNVLNKKNVFIEADWLVLATPLVPQKDMDSMSKLLKVPLSESGFFLEAHVKHRPLDFATDGIFVCGTCHSPKSISETISQANGAATRALIPLLNGIVESDALIALVDSERCVGCEICELSCPYGAARLVEVEENIFKSEINPAVCKGCGVCVAGCPVNAISLKNYEDPQINAMIKSGLENVDPAEPRIIVFLCNWCSYAGADNAGVSRFQYPPNIRPIRVMCSGRVAIQHVLNALLYGADGVLVTGCHIGDCHYISGNYKTERRVKLAKDLLKLAGISPHRLRLEWITASEGNRFAQVIKEFTNEIKALKSENMV
ncbi:MAG: hydrogenase iron-sulfur subunit [Candidatus Helarchaeota archaeon]|nr:hydrogenase iron-sulfur subunit [Candidatus Helarchaeota archaeon]